MKFKKHVFVCANTKEAPKKCCNETNGLALVEAFREKLKAEGKQMTIRVQKAGCIDMCAFGPSMVVYPEGVFYGNVQMSDIDEIVDKHLINDVVVDRLVI
ncbi:MAG: (2Fe-2S) ferredoxin domain-containing protein [Pseudarcicella sp.]|nr:(2Fe-2S) ferredoxin domain-containing protein [Pseudarcicella sp.]MBP6409517.1 (2Fe-2S) ferredoxin domain-containing protein [Pseudarcicella sp.]